MDAINSSEEHQYGLTLIEILVVIAIIGIMVTVAFLSINVLTRRAEVDNFVNSLQQSLVLAGQKAILQRRRIGLFIHQHYLTFYSYKSADQTWHKIDQDISLQQRKIPEGSTMQLWDGNRQIALPADDALLNDPQIIFAQGGTLTPFVLRFVGKNAKPVQLRGDYGGKILLPSA